MNRLIIIAFCAGVLSSFIGGTLGIMAASPYTQERTEKIFVYGTLTNPLFRAYACVCFTEFEPTFLNGYVKGVRNIHEAPSSRVKGGIIEVSKTELTRIDAYEGVPHHYRREQVEVDGETVWVYIKNTLEE